MYAAVVVSSAGSARSLRYVAVCLEATIKHSAVSVDGGVASTSTSARSIHVTRSVREAFETEWHEQVQGLCDEIHSHVTVHVDGEERSNHSERCIQFGSRPAGQTQTSRVPSHLFKQSSCLGRTTHGERYMGRDRTGQLMYDVSDDYSVSA